MYIYHVMNTDVQTYDIIQYCSMTIMLCAHKYTVTTKATTKTRPYFDRPLKATWKHDLDEQMKIFKFHNIF